MNHLIYRSVRWLMNITQIPTVLWLILDWQPKHTERNVVKVVGAVPAAEKDRKLPSDLDHHAFTKFTNIYFKVSLSFHFWWKAMEKKIHKDEQGINKFFLVYRNFYRIICGVPRKRLSRHHYCPRLTKLTSRNRWLSSSWSCASWMSANSRVSSVKWR